MRQTIHSLFLQCVMLFFLANAFGVGVMAQQTLDDEAKRLLNAFSKDEQSMALETYRLAQYNTVVSEWKEQGAKKPSKIPSSLFTGAAYRKWILLKQEMEDIVWGDFFTGAIVIPCAWNERAAVSVLYNPWWDAAMQVRLEAKPEGMAIASFELVSGEVLRGEKAKEVPAYSSVVADKGAQAAVWFDLLSRTRQTLDAKYSEIRPETVTFSCTLEELSRTQMQLRAVMRLTQFKECFSIPATKAEMIAYARILHHGTVEDIKPVFPDADSQELFGLMEKLGPEFRATIIPYGFWASEMERMYLFVCMEQPRLAFMVYVHTGRQAEFEWYDMNEADSMLTILKQSSTVKEEN